MKKAFAAACAVLAVALFGASRAESQSADLGETNLHNVACAFAITQAVRAGFPLKWCRQDGPIVEGVNDAAVPLRVNLPGMGKYKVVVYLYKSLWSSHFWTAEPE